MYYKIMDELIYPEQAVEDCIEMFGQKLDIPVAELREAALRYECIVPAEAPNDPISNQDDKNDRKVCSMIMFAAMKWMAENGRVEK